MSYLTNFDTLLSSMMNDGQTTQSPQDLYRIYHGMFMDVSAALPISNEGAGAYLRARTLQSRELT